jgi:5-formaminoimidazole-4-carboxamide-1-(beta)-D-ribofuranosyl 5'-monophosphate synthetase
MIEKDEIDGIVKGYKDITVATICSHTALQIFAGAKDEGFRTLGICKPELRETYEAFPLAEPDIFLEVADYSDILKKSVQEKLRKENAIVVPHGSFVEYVGAQDILDNFSVPLFGNRGVLVWESDRKRAEKWLKDAGIRMPKTFADPVDIDRLVMVKFPGAKGGRSYFLAENQNDFEDGMEKSGLTGQDYTIQEYVVGTRFYPHYFYSPITDRTELLSMDIRYESNIDGIGRIPHLTEHVDPTFVVTGNLPVVVRESLIPRILEMGESVVEVSKKLFAPGISGPFCIETTCTDKLEFVAFEISARIVAGTNLFMQGSPYSQLIYREPMSTGRRIARELKIAKTKRLLASIVY